MAKNFMNVKVRREDPNIFEMEMELLGHFRRLQRPPLATTEVQKLVKELKPYVTVDPRDPDNKIQVRLSCQNPSVCQQLKEELGVGSGTEVMSTRLVSLKLEVE